MSLQIWLPLINDLHNQGVHGSASISGGNKQTSGGKLGAGHYKVYNGAGLTITHTIPDTTEFSYCYWINIPSTITSVGAWQTFMSIYAKHNDTASYAAVSWASYNLMKWYDSTGYDQKLWLSFSYDTWYHIAVVHSSGNLKIYVNGELGSRDYSMSQVIKLTAGSITIGNGLNATNGKIGLQDFRLYNKTLTASEVKEISKGLVCHYTLSKEGVLEATTNIHPQLGPDGCYNGSNSKYGFNNDTDFHYTDGTFQGRYCRKVYEGTLRSTNNFYPSFYSLHPQSNGAYKTLSFDLYPTQGTSMTFYTYNGSGTVTYISNGVAGSGGTVPIIPNRWNHLEVTIKSTSSATSGYDYAYFGEHTQAGHYWLFANVLIEEKDHATYYTPSSRSTGLVYDSSGYCRNLSITGSVSPADSPRYKKGLYLANLNINSNYLIANGWSPSGFLTTGSISFWCKFNGLGSSGWLPFIGLSGSYYVMATSGGSGNFYHEQVGSATKTIYRDGVAVSAPSDNGNWHHYCITGVDISNWTNFKVNLYGSSWDSNMYISDIRIYNTVLSADDVSDLYKLGALIS